MTRDRDPGSARRARENLAGKYAAQAKSVEDMQSNVYKVGVEASKVEQPKHLSLRQIWAGARNEPTAKQARAANDVKVGRKLLDLENIAATKRKYAATAKRMSGGK